MARRQRRYDIPDSDVSEEELEDFDVKSSSRKPQIQATVAPLDGKPVLQVRPGAEGTKRKAPDDPPAISADPTSGSAESGTAQAAASSVPRKKLKLPPKPAATAAHASPNAPTITNSAPSSSQKAGFGPPAQQPPPAPPRPKLVLNKARVSSGDDGAPRPSIGGLRIKLTAPKKPVSPMLEANGGAAAPPAAAIAAAAAADGAVADAQKPKPVRMRHIPKKPPPAAEQGLKQPAGRAAQVPSAVSQLPPPPPQIVPSSQADEPPVGKMLVKIGGAKGKGSKGSKKGTVREKVEEEPVKRERSGSRGEEAGESRGKRKRAPRVASDTQATPQPHHEEPVTPAETKQNGAAERGTGGSGSASSRKARARRRLSVKVESEEESDGAMAEIKQEGQEVKRETQDVKVKDEGAEKGVKVKVEGDVVKRTEEDGRRKAVKQEEEDEEKDDADNQAGGLRMASTADVTSVVLSPQFTTAELASITAEQQKQQQEAAAAAAAAKRAKQRAELPVGKTGKMEILKGLNRDGVYPREFIREFQTRNGLHGVAEAVPAVQMLDMLAVPRPQVYLNMFMDLRAKLEDRIEKCTNEAQLLTLLTSSFIYIKVPELRPIPEKIISKLKVVPKKYVNMLAKVPAILDQLPIRVKQQVWESHPELFREAISVYVKEYITNSGGLSDHASYPPVQLGRGFVTQKRREDSTALSQLVACINKDGLKLESEAYDHLVNQYVKTGEPALCTLLGDLNVMLAHARIGRANVDSSKLTSLARSLDELVREGTVDPKSLMQVQANIRAIIRSSEAAAKPPTSAPIRAGVDLNRVPTLERALNDSFRHLCHTDAKGVFGKPVVEVWPALKDEYLAFISHPMDFGTMREKIRTGQYEDFASFDTDAQLVFGNCMKYNQPATEYYMVAERQMNSWNKWKLKFKDVDLKVAAERMRGLNKTKQTDTNDLKDPTVPTPLPHRERVEGSMFGYALMLLADPLVVQVLGRTIMRKLTDEVQKTQGLPKDHPLLPSLLQLLHLGLTARKQLSDVSTDGHFVIHKHEESYVEALRNVLPCYLELSGYVTLKTKYDAAGWEGQPHDKEMIQGNVNLLVNRLYSLVKKQLPSALLLRLLQHLLVDSAYHVEDGRTDLLAETLKQLLAFSRRKNKLDPFPSDHHNRFLWAALATAAIHRGTSKVTFEKELKDRLLSVSCQELPHVDSPVESWLHEQLVRLVSAWVAKGILKEDEVKGVLSWIVEGLGGAAGENDVKVGQAALKAHWELMSFKAVRAMYEKVVGDDVGLREVIGLVRVKEGDGMDQTQ